MLEACRESRHSGKMVEKLVEGIAVQVSQSGYIGYIRDEVNQSGNIGDYKSRGPPTSRLWPFGPALGLKGLLDNVFHALRALRPCDPRNQNFI